MIKLYNIPYIDTHFNVVLFQVSGHYGMEYGKRHSEIQSLPVGANENLLKLYMYIIYMLCAWWCTY